jgi:hypothetical protein
MAQKRFDPTLKTLAETYPVDWTQALCALLGLPRERQVKVIDSDVSTVSAAVDKVYRVGKRRPWILHLEFVSSHNARLARQTMLYNVLLGERHDLPVESVVILLRPEADRGSLTGVHRRKGVDGKVVVEFQYKIVRVWQVPAETFLKGGLGVLALATVAKVPEERLPAVLRQMETRLQAEATPEQTREVWTATFLLLGLNHPRDFVIQLFQGIHGMTESSTYQAILAEGALRGARKILLDLAREDLGAPDATAQAALEGINELSEIEGLIRRLKDAATWQELLQAPTSSRGKKHKRSS